MTTYTITTGHDTYADSSNPTKSYATGPYIYVGLVQQGYIYFPLPAELAGQAVASATLTGVLAGAPAFAYASATVTTTLVSSSWSDSTTTWNRRPSLSGLTQATSVGAGHGGDLVALSVDTLMQAVASGQGWYGFQLSASTGSPVFNSFESGLTTPWTLTIVTTEAPDIPQALVPNGTVVGSGKPTLSCDFVDNGGVSNLMGAIQVQIDPAQNSASPAFDSGTVASTLPLLDLTTTAYAGLASGSTTYWRVRVQDTSGLWSGWSDWAAFTYRPRPTLTLLTPAAGVLYDPTTDVIASTSANISAYRVRITSASDRTDVRFDSGRLPANPAALTTIDVPLPEKYHNQRVLVDDRNYQLHIQAWDTYANRQATPGLPNYVESWTTFHFDDDLAVSPVATLVADQPDRSPAVELTWTRAAAPDAWVVLRDSKVIARLDPADTIVGASTWSWTDTEPRGWVEHTYNVKAISGGHQGNKGPTISFTPEGYGIWLYTQDGQRVGIDGADVSQLTMVDRRSTYKPLNLRYDVDIVTGFEGISGSLAGVVPSELDEDVEVSDAMSVLQSIKENPGQTVHLLYGNFSAPVLVRNLAVVPHPNSTPAVPLMSVSFGVNQVGNFDQAD